MDQGSEIKPPQPATEPAPPINPAPPVPKPQEVIHPGMKGFLRRLFRGEEPGPRNPAGPNPLLYKALEKNGNPYHPGSNMNENSKPQETANTAESANTKEQARITEITTELSQTEKAA